MIAWVDDQCRAWSAHYRWILTGEDGWPERSMLGKLIDEGYGAGQGAFTARVPIKDPPEKYTNVSIALQRMKDLHMDKPVQIVYLHYLVRGKARNKAPDLGVSVPQYWNILNTAHAFIAGSIDVPRGALSRLEISCA